MTFSASVYSGLAEIRAELSDNLLTLGDELAVACGHDAVALVLRLNLHVSDDLLTLGTRFLHGSALPRYELRRAARGTARALLLPPPVRLRLS